MSIKQQGDFKMAEQYEHVQYLAVKPDGTEHECVIIKEFPNGDVAYVDLTKLDKIDLDRLTGIIRKRDANKYPLWDVMSNTTLRNGENALEYFHQLTEVLTTNGSVIGVGLGVRGSNGVRNVKTPDSITGERPLDDVAEPKTRGPGRPAGSTNKK